jgi:transketolase
VAAARETGAIVTAEEHSVIGGLGAAVAEVVTDRGLAVPVKRIGLRDRFASSGTYVEMLDAYGMSVADVKAAAREALALKR